MDLGLQNPGRRPFDPCGAGGLHGEGGKDAGPSLAIAGRFSMRCRAMDAAAGGGQAVCIPSQVADTSNGASVGRKLFV